MKTIIIKISGMHCAACSAGVERSLKKVAGVEAVNVNLASNSAQIRYNENITTMEMLENAITRMSFGVVHDDDRESNGDQLRYAADLAEMHKKLVVAASFFVPLLYLAMAPMLIDNALPLFLTPEANPKIFVFAQLLLVLPILWAGMGFFKNGWLSLKNFMPSMDTLVGLGTGAAFIYSANSVIGTFAGKEHAVHQLYFESAGAIITFVLFGKYLELKSKGRASNAINELLKLVPKTGWIIRDGEEIEVARDEIMAGDLVVVKNGFQVPVDGKIESGIVSINEAMLTGESMPVTKRAGDDVFAATIVVDGNVKFRANKVGKDTVLAQIMKMVEEAQGSKAPIAKLADQISAVFVPVVLVIAILAGGGWFLAGKDLAFSLQIFVAVLVIACPCALGLATPVAIMVAVGKGAEKGILFKNAEALETARKATVVVFDKTGTLTEGKPVVTDVKTFGGYKEEEVLALGWAVEDISNHPLAQAIKNKAQEVGAIKLEATVPKTFVGGGMQAIIGEALIRIGNESFLTGIEMTAEIKNITKKIAEDGKTPVFLARDNNLIAIFAIADALKSEAGATISSLRQLNLRTVVLTGDNKITAQAIAKEAGVDEFVAELLPENKADIIKQLQAAGEVVVMVGDGINDAPALVLADLGIAVGSGTDVAIESADVVLVSGDIKGIVTAIRLSKATIRNVKENLGWAFGYNIIGIPIAAGLLYAFGGSLLNPMFAAAAMSLSSVSVITNALRLNNFK